MIASMSNIYCINLIGEQIVSIEIDVLNTKNEGLISRRGSEDNISYR